MLILVYFKDYYIRYYIHYKNKSLWTTILEICAYHYVYFTSYYSKILSFTIYYNFEVNSLFLIYKIPSTPALRVETTSLML